MLRNTVQADAKSHCASLRRIDNLALEGGGAKGYYHFGALLALHQLGILKKVKRIAGTSIGAFLGFKIALGYTPDVLIKKEFAHYRQHKQLDFLDFIPNNKDTHYQFTHSDYRVNRFFKTIYNLGKSCIDVFYQRGICYGKYIEDELMADIQEKFPNKTSLTFRELHQLKSAHPELHLKDIYITAMNVSDNCLAVFSHETTPDMPIPTAVRCSMAVPGVYKPVEYLGKLYLDGGLKCNLPIHLFDNTKYIEDGNLLTNQVNMRTLGLCLSSPLRTQKMRDDIFNNAKSNTGMLGSLLELIFMPIILQDFIHRFSSNPLRTVFLDTQDIQIFNYKISKDKAINAIKCASMQTKEYVENYIKNVPDPHAESLESKINKLKIILRFYSLFIPQVCPRVQIACPSRQRP